MRFRQSLGDEPSMGRLSQGRCQIDLVSFGSVATGEPMPSVLEQIVATARVFKHVERLGHVVKAKYFESIDLTGHRLPFGEPVKPGIGPVFTQCSFELRL